MSVWLKMEECDVFHFLDQLNIEMKLRLIVPNPSEAQISLSFYVPPSIQGCRLFLRVEGAKNLAESVFI